MITKMIFTNNGTLLAYGFNRIVHGKRGNYVEFEYEHFLTPLQYRYGKDFNKEELLYDDEWYYIWLRPSGDFDTKIYFQ